MQFAACNSADNFNLDYSEPISTEVGLMVLCI